jgi:hypothetical protein
MRVTAFSLLALVLVGCESMRPSAPAPTQPPPVTAPVRVVGKPPEPPKSPVEILRTAATQPAPDEDDPLTSVSKCLERDDHLGAAIHLEGYVRAHPDQPMFRLQLAELYLRAERRPEAKGHLEQFIARAQGGPATLQPHLVTAHIKLRDIAVGADDRFGEAFHRGAGLLLLVKEQDGDPKRDDTFCEEMLCKSLRALTEAKGLKPGDARVRAYLADVQERMGNRRAADTERAAARADVVPAVLTETERGWLLLRE